MTTLDHGQSMEVARIQTGGITGELRKTTECGRNHRRTNRCTLRMHIVGGRLERSCYTQGTWLHRVTALHGFDYVRRGKIMEQKN